MNSSGSESGSASGSVASTEASPAVPSQRSAETAASGKRFYVPEIEGLRGLAIVLIVIFHVWFNRVSGGVDVFFVLSGFLITLSLLRAAESAKGIQAGRYVSRIVRRITPPALVVLAGVVVASILWLPKSRWGDTMGEIVSSAFYFGNYWLAENSVDYLASQNEASVVQHYWSMAVQFQFYLLWPLVIGAAALAVKAARRYLWPDKELNLRGFVAGMIGLVFVSSFAWSLWQTSTSQTYAYFDTRARLWEFALGGLLVLAMPYLRFHRAFSNVLAWAGLAALISTGFLFTGSEFPGWAALVPTLGAIAVIASAVAQPDTTASKLLRTPLMQTLGRHAFTIFLWHWPVLILYLQHTGHDLPTLGGGMIIIAVSVGLAIITRWLVEVRLPATGFGQHTIKGGFALGASCLALVMVAMVAWYAVIEGERNRVEALASDTNNYPGAHELADNTEVDREPLIPSLMDAHLDDELELRDECHQNIVGVAVKYCELGSDDPDYTIAIIGPSKAWQWVPAFLEFHEENDWRVITMTKNACQFSAHEVIYQGEVYEDCNDWNDGVMEKLEELQPDGVFTLANRVDGNGEYTDEGYIERWEQLEDMGTDVFAMRDTPRPDFDIPQCVEEHGIASPECELERSGVYPNEEAEVFTDFDLPGNVTNIDLVNYVCDEETCPPVVGNVLVYQDTTHITATYMRTLAPYLEDRLAKSIAS